MRTCHSEEHSDEEPVFFRFHQEQIPPHFVRRNDNTLDHNQTFVRAGTPRAYRQQIQSRQGRTYRTPLTPSSSTNTKYEQAHSAVGMVPRGRVVTITL